MSHVHDENIGAWLLGALDEPDATDFSAHLAGCERCRDEVAALQFVSDNLPLAAPLESPPSALRSRIMAVVESEAELLRAAGPAVDRAAFAVPADRSGRLRRWFGGVRPFPAAALACSLLLAGLVAGSIVSSGGDDGPSPRTRTILADTTVPNPKAKARIEVAGDNVRLAVSAMPAPPKGRVYQVWLKRDGEAAEPTRTLFDVRREGRATVAIDEPLGDADELLVTAEPDGGSIIPTRQPVLRASL